MLPNNPVRMEMICSMDLPPASLEDAVNWWLKYIEVP